LVEIIVKKIKDSYWFVGITAFSGIEILEIDNFLSLVSQALESDLFQVFNADNIAGWEHLYLATINAVKSFQTDSSISNSLPIETMLYASCQDQINRAFQIVGINQRTVNIAITIFSSTKKDILEGGKALEKLFSEENEKVLEMDEKKMERLKSLFDITNRALKTIGDDSKGVTKLIIEKGALIPTTR
jgi:tRNA threonylcarbamoyladenosine modification (KEOPS) complex Cgi121 subunit